MEQHLLVRAMVREMIESDEIGTRVDECASVLEARSYLRRFLAPDLILLGLSSPGGESWALVDALLEQRTGISVVLLASRHDEYTLWRAGDAPVVGFIDNSTTTVGEYRDALRAVCGGRRYYSPQIFRKMRSLRCEPDSWIHKLSRRELEVLPFLATGLGNDEIAQRVSVSAGTIMSHRKRIMAKLNVHSVAELMRWAIETGFYRWPMAGSDLNVLSVENMAVVARAACL